VNVVDPNNPVPPASEPDPRDAEIAQLKAELDAKDAALRDAQNAAETAKLPTAPVSRVAAIAGIPTDTPEEAPAGQVQSEPAIGPGSAGPPVAELAGLLEAAGEKTYLSGPNASNAAHVFTDELMATVRRALFNHPEIAAATGAEGEEVKRWIRDLEIVSADAWQLLRELAGDTPAPTSTTGTTPTA